MDKRFKFREMIKYRAGALCLIGILSATYMHSTAFMSQFFYQSLLLGGIAAFAIDAGVVAMSIFKDELLKTGELAWMVRVVTVMVLFASGVANMAEGFQSAYGLSLTTANLMALDALTWTQWLAGTIVFPILAYVMCDTIGTRNLVNYKQGQGGGSSAGARGGNRVWVGANAQQQLRAANRTRFENKADRKERVRMLLDENPRARMDQLVTETGVSPNTVRKYISELKSENKVKEVAPDYSPN